jgi:murein DD-endopeptidase MepM/ murein hydrolase activator NlpD
MKNRRRKGVSAAGVVAVALLAAPTSADSGRLDASRPGSLAPSGQAGAPRDARAPTTGAVRTPAHARIRVRVAEALAAPPPRPAPTVYCPVAGPVEFVDSWGFRRSGGRRHQGVDMLAARGTPVVAPVDGLVSNRGNATGGLSFHLIAADGTYFYGTHLSAYGATGQVAAGTVVGYVGDSGNARGTPHLHFEVHPGGEGTPAVNPYDVAAAWCTAERIVTPDPAAATA